MQKIESDYDTGNYVTATIIINISKGHNLIEHVSAFKYTQWTQLSTIGIKTTAKVNITDESVI